MADITISSDKTINIAKLPCEETTIIKDTDHLVIVHDNKVKKITLGKMIEDLGLSRNLNLENLPNIENQEW